MNPGDVNEDGRVSASDVVAILNQLDRDDLTSNLFTDCNGDGETTAQDALLVINELSDEPVDAESNDGSESSPTVDDHHHDLESEHDHYTDEEDSDEMLDENEQDVGEDDEPDEEAGHEDDDSVDSDESPSSETDPNATGDAGTDDTESPASDVLETESSEDDQADGETSEQEADDEEADESDEIDDDDSPSMDAEEDEEDIDDSDDEDDVDVGQANPDSQLGRVASRLFDILDTNSDGYLDSEELPPALLDALRSIDLDEDGRISREEVQQQIPSHQARRFQRLDDNQDGVIDPDEVSPQFWERLVEYDVDASEGIDSGEWDAFLASKPPRDFRRLDDNEDGVITEQEVNPRLWERLSSLDEDGNQAIDPDEFDSRLGRRVGRFAGFLRPIRRGRFF